jgi:hypothetical protein
MKFDGNKRDFHMKRNTYILLGLIIGFIVCSASVNAIYGGKLVEKGELNAIGKVTPKGCPECLCTGTLIQGNVVLTAAHCFENIHQCPKPNYCIANFTVDGHSFAGKVEKYKNYEVGREDFDNDIALIILDENVSKELGIKPIPIAGYQRPIAHNVALNIIGFGNISEDCCSKPNLEEKKYNCTLRVWQNRPRLQTITLKPCELLQTRTLVPCDNEPIAGICPGDSGGPALDMNNKIVAIATWDVIKTSDDCINLSEKSGGNIFTEINRDNKENKIKYKWIQCVMKNAREKTEIDC